MPEAVISRGVEVGVYPVSACSHARARARRAPVLMARASCRGADTQVVRGGQVDGQKRASVNLNTSSFKERAQGQSPIASYKGGKKPLV